MRRFLQDNDDVWGEKIHVHVDALFDLGSKTLASFVFRGRGRQSGVETEVRLFQVATWRDELIIHLKSYSLKEDALEEPGMSETALQEFAD